MPNPLLFDPVIDRFVSKIESGEGCWVWLGAHSGDGYSIFTIKHENYLAHRLAYELWVADIPEGLVIDHECHSKDLTCTNWDTCPHRGCVNPQHLKPVTRLQNVLLAHPREVH